MTDFIYDRFVLFHNTLIAFSIQKLLTCGTALLQAPHSDIVHDCLVLFAPDALATSLLRHFRALVSCPSTRCSLHGLMEQAGIHAHVLRYDDSWWF